MSEEQVLANIALILFMHLIGDFFLQSDWMAQNKSKSNKALTVHAACYCLPFVYFGWLFIAVTCACHWGVDFVTSRINSRLWRIESKHCFFVGIGIDQFIHAIILIFTFWILEVQK